MTTASAGPQPASVPLPMWRLLGAAIADLVFHPGRLLRLAWPWLALTVVLAVSTSLLPRTPENATGVAVLLYVVQLVAGLSVALAWHRALLLGAEPSGLAAISFGRRFWRFVRVGMLVGLLLAVCILPVQFIILGLAARSMSGGEAVEQQILALGAVVLIPTILASLATSRTILAFPQAAIDGAGGAIRQSWEMTRGNAWRIAIPMTACVMISYFLDGVVTFAGNMAMADADSEISVSFYTILVTAQLVPYLVGAALMASFASRAYALIGGRQLAVKA